MGFVLLRPICWVVGHDWWDYTVANPGQKSQDKRRCQRCSQREIAS